MENRSLPVTSGNRSTQYWRVFFFLFCVAILSYNRKLGIQIIEPDWNEKIRDICFRSDWIYICSTCIYIYIIAAVNCFRPTRHINVYCISATYIQLGHTCGWLPTGPYFEKGPPRLCTIYTYLLSRYSSNTVRSFRSGVTI